MRDTIINVHKSSCKVPITFVKLSTSLNFLNISSKNTQISNFMEIRQVGAELFHAEGETAARTEKHDEANSRFSQFSESA
jgi:hypothetical protein